MLYSAPHVNALKQIPKNCYRKFRNLINVNQLLHFIQKKEFTEIISINFVLP